MFVPLLITSLVVSFILFAMFSEEGSAWAYPIGFYGVFDVLVGLFLYDTPHENVAIGFFSIMPIIFVLAAIAGGLTLAWEGTEQWRKQRRQTKSLKKLPHEVYPEILDYRPDDKVRYNGDATFKRVNGDHTVTVLFDKYNEPSEVRASDFFATAHNYSLIERQRFTKKEDPYWATLVERYKIADEAQRLTDEDMGEITTTSSRDKLRS